MNALERAARAAAEVDAVAPGAYQRIARAVLMAVREPDMAIYVDADTSEDDHPVVQFTAMIDAILADGGE